MKFSRFLIALLACACTAPRPPHADSPDPATRGGELPIVAPTISVERAASSASEPEHAVTPPLVATGRGLERERALVDAANAAVASVDLALASAKAAEAVALLKQHPDAERDHDWCKLLDDAGLAAWNAQDLSTARAASEAVLAAYLRTLPDDDRNVQAARSNCASVIAAQGDLAGARDLEEKVLEVFTRTLPDDHHDLQVARLNLAGTLEKLGDDARVLGLQEKVLEVFARTRAPDDFELQWARIALAATLYGLGDLVRARDLEERALDAFTRTLPEDNPDLQVARVDLSGTLRLLGDYAGARELDEKALASLSRTLPEDNSDLQAARANLAGVLFVLGDAEGARTLQEEVLAAQTRTLPAGHKDIQIARLELGSTLRALGDAAGARNLQGLVLAERERTLAPDHPDVVLAQQSLAIALYDLGELAAAQALEEKVLAACTRTLPDGHPELEAARANLAVTRAVRAVREPDAGTAQSARAACAELISAFLHGNTHAARAILYSASGREAEERCAGMTRDVSIALSFANGFGAFAAIPELEPDCFRLAETTRDAAIASAAIARASASDARYPRLFAELRAASDDLAALVRRGTNAGEFDRARARRDAAERALVALHGAAGDALSGTGCDARELATHLEEHAALVGYWRYTRSRVMRADEREADGPAARHEENVDSLCAFVVRRARQGGNGAPLVRVELGPIAPIERAVHAWRDAIGTSAARGLAADTSIAEIEHARGSDLRALVIDPLLDALGDTERIVVALDDVLHLVPLDALPTTTPGERLGDRWRIETRATLSEVRASRPKPEGDALVALGGASFNAAPIGPAAEDVAAVQATAVQPEQLALVLRGGAWERGFSPLPFTGDEARQIAALHEEIASDPSTSIVLDRRRASRAALVELAPRARWLHVATHGWFAEDSIRSWADPSPLDRHTGIGSRASGAEQVKGMSPMLLCGLALAGANLPEDDVGRAPGLITAEEIAALDLSHCELAVLSACDTNVGERRAGQGVASLQKALQMAGARAVITSLWRVSDEATKELMLDFYRRLWVQHEPKARALWKAKRRLRDARDEAGKPAYAVRDWAAWVLTGEPD